MASSSSTRRRAWDGNEYTAEEFELFYGEEHWEAIWDNAPAGDVAQLADDFANLDASNTGGLGQTTTVAWFDWIPYVAAHPESQRIVGPGITQAVARFTEGTTDANRGGAPRLDFCYQHQ